MTQEEMDYLIREQPHPYGNYEIQFTSTGYKQLVLVLDEEKIKKADALQ